MNWGKGITVFMMLFIAFIASMVYYAFTLNADLVMEDYYEHERTYDTDKENRLNYAALNEPVVIEKTEKGVLFRLPHQTSRSTEGSIHFYRPDEKKLDCTFDLHLDNNHEQLLDYNYFVEGYYDVSITWQDKTISYLFEDHIQF